MSTSLFKKKKKADSICLKFFFSVVATLKKKKELHQLLQKSSFLKGNTILKFTLLLL